MGQQWYNKYYISLIIIVLTNITYCQEPIKNSVRFEGYYPQENCFISQLMQSKTMDYNSRTTLLFESTCWEHGMLDSTFCALLFNYCLIDSKINEELSEGISFQLYNLFTKNPYSILQLNYFINLTEKTCQERLLEKILSDLFYETAVREEQNEDETKLSEIDFFRIFPYFFSNDNFIRIHNIIESYYEE